MLPFCPLLSLAGVLWFPIDYLIQLYKCIYLHRDTVFLYLIKRFNGEVSEDTLYNKLFHHEGKGLYTRRKDVRLIKMEWYVILSLVLTVVTTLAALFITYKVRIITNFKTLFDGVRNEEDLEALADLLGIGVDMVIKLFSIFKIDLTVGDE